MSDQQAPPAPPTETPNDADVPESDPGAVRPGLFRGRAIYAAAAVGFGVIAAVVIFSLTANSGGDAGNTEVIAADDPAASENDPAADSTAATPEDARSIELGPATTQGEFSVTLQTDPEGLLRVDLDDPETPSLQGQAPQHCVYVLLSGPAQVEAYGCTDVAVESTEELLTLSNPGDPVIGCAAVAVNAPPQELSPIMATSAFLVDQDTVLPAGDYEVSVAAVSGTGDGCPPADGPAERIAASTAALRIN